MAHRNVAKAAKISASLLGFGLTPITGKGGRLGRVEANRKSAPGLGLGTFAFAQIDPDRIFDEELQIEFEKRCRRPLMPPKHNEAYMLFLAFDRRYSRQSGKKRVMA